MLVQNIKNNVRTYILIGENHTGLAQAKSYIYVP